jgi:hypothetical protein
MADSDGYKRETLPPTAERPGRRLERGIVVGGMLLLVSLGLMLSHQSGRQPAEAATGFTDRNHERPNTAFEPTDWQLGAVGWIFAGTLLLLVISPLVLMLAFPRALPDVGRNLRISPPGPRLQVDPRKDLVRFRAEEEKRLNTYYWIDKQKAVVHIPIQQAISKLVKNGIPGFPKAQQ